MRLEHCVAYFFRTEPKFTKVTSWPCGCGCSTKLTKANGIGTIAVNRWISSFAWIIFIIQFCSSFSFGFILCINNCFLCCHSKKSFFLRFQCKSCFHYRSAIQLNTSASSQCQRIHIGYRRRNNIANKIRNCTVQYFTMLSGWFLQIINSC